MDSTRSLSLLAGSDLHNNGEGWDWFLAVARQRRPDCIAFLGDFVTREPLEFVIDCARDLIGLADSCLVIPGNWDPRQALVELDRLAGDGLKNLHKDSAYIGGFTFAGLGGSTTTPVGNTPFESTPDNFGAPLLPLLPADVWVLHNPVQGFRDKVASGANVGSGHLRELWEEQVQKPLLALSGHIHEAGGFEEHGGTVFVNPGTLQEKSAAWIELAGNSVRGEMLEG